MVPTWLRDVMKKEFSSGLLLLVAAALALWLANSQFAWLYNGLLDTPVEVRIGTLQVAKPLLLWINDGLMAIFFLLIGLEVKREILEGDLSSPAQILLPAVGALGGMLFPALFYVAFNYGDARAMNGWAIPAATDIAFALGVLAVLGRRVPLSLRVFLMALAIFDDLGAILIIAFFYSGDLSTQSLVIAGVAIGGLLLLNLLGVSRIGPYVLVGLVLWVAVLKSGVHATLAGVVLGFAVPMRVRRQPGVAPLRHLERELHPWVAFLIVPLFAFANAGVPLQGLSLNSLLEPVPLGIASGLFLGKQIGVMVLCGLLIRAGWARLPAGATWLGFYGVAVLCGIGFTMSLFVGSLAFEHEGGGAPMMDRLGILLGSALSALVGYLILRLGRPGVVEAPAPS